MLPDVRVLTTALDPTAEQASLWLGNPRVGALVSFIGLTRDQSEDGRVSRLTLEHYPGMTEKALVAIATEAAQRWPVEAIRILHRVGDLEPQDPIVLVAVAASHRGDAFRCCEFLIDYLKIRAPFWKKETRAQGSRWVIARAADNQAASRWDAATADPPA